MSPSALELHDVGLSVIPIRSGTKQPAVNWKRFQEKRPSRSEVERWPQNCQTLAVVTGAVSGLVVVDCDSDQAELWARRNLPNTPLKVKTGKGVHLYYRHPGCPVSNKARIKTDIPGLELDLRGDGGYVLAPGSLHPSGSTYEVLEGLDLLCAGDEGKLLAEKLPVFCSSWLGQPAAPSTDQRPGGSSDNFERAVKYVAKIPGAPEGQRNSTANTVAYKIAQGFGITGPEGFRILSDWNLGCTPPLDDRELETVWESACKAASAQTGFLRDAQRVTNGRKQESRASADQQEADSGLYVQKSSVVLPDSIDRGAVHSLDLVFLDRSAPPMLLVADMFKHVNREAVPQIVYGPQGLSHVVRARSLLVPITSAKALSAQVQQGVGFLEVRENSEGFRSARQVTPPVRVCEMALDLDPSQTSLPTINGLTTVPKLGADGSLVLEPGYKPESKYLFLPKPGTPKFRASNRYSAQEVSQALGLLWQPLREFPFADEGSRANTLALVLLPFVREATGLAPLHLIAAPCKGTGKSLLAEVALWPFFGGFDANNPPDNVQHVNEFTDEMADREIGSMLMYAPDVAFADNWNGRLSGGHWAKVLTSAVIDHRILGTSQRRKLKNTPFWVVTSNNPKQSDELARRTCPITLDARTENPELRTGFADVRTWCFENRWKLVQAALVLVQHWLNCGQPKGSVTLGSFQRWADVMGGILGCAGVAGFLTNYRDHLDSRDEESEEWRAFVGLWWETHASEAVTTQELIQLVRRTSAPSAVFRKPSDQGQLTALGSALKSRDGRIYGGLRIVKVGMSRGYSRYRLSEHQEPVASVSPPAPVLDADLLEGAL